MTQHTKPSATSAAPPDSMAKRITHSPSAVTIVATVSVLLTLALFALAATYALDRAVFGSVVTAATNAVATALVPIELVAGVMLAAAYSRQRRRQRSAPAALNPSTAGTLSDSTVGAAAELRALLIQYYDLAADQELVLQTAADGIYRTGPDGHVVFANRSMETMLQRTQAELHGQNIHELAHYRRADGREYPQAQCPLHNPASTTIQATVDDDVMWRKDGSPIAVAVTSTPTRHHGEGSGTVVVVRDVTRRTAEEAQHRLDEERYRAIVETTPEWIWEMDTRGNYTYSNPAGHRLLGYMPKEIVGRSMLSIIHPDDRVGVEALLPALLDEKRGWMGYTLHWIRKDGGHRTTLSNGVPILDSHGDVCGFRGEERDLTERSAVDATLTPRA